MLWLTLRNPTLAIPSDSSQKNIRCVWHEDCICMRQSNIPGLKYHSAHVTIIWVNWVNENSPLRHVKFNSFVKRDYCSIRYLIMDLLQQMKWSRRSWTVFEDICDCKVKWIQIIVYLIWTPWRTDKICDKRTWGLQKNCKCQVTQIC